MGCASVPFPRFFPGVLAVSLLVGLIPEASGDVVHLKSGRTIEGTTAPGRKAGTMEVRTGGGVVMTIPTSDILRIEKKRSPAEEFDARLGALPAGEIEPARELLVFARDKKLTNRVRLVARRILRVDPDDELARQALGYVVFRNRWILESDLRRKQGLVRFRGEWMTESEKTTLIENEAAAELEELLDLVDSENLYVQEFSIRKILSRKDPVARKVFHAHLTDPRRIPRMVAIRGMVNFPVEGGGDAVDREAARDLHGLALEEKSPEVLKVLFPTLARYCPAENFRLARNTLLRSDDATTRRRAAEVLYYTLRVATVPVLCRTLVTSDGKRHPEVREVLRRALGVDHGMDVDAWLRFWEANRHRFTDE